MCTDSAPEKLLALVLGQEIFRYVRVLGWHMRNWNQHVPERCPGKILVLVLEQDFSAMPGYRSAHAELE